MGRSVGSGFGSPDVAVARSDFDVGGHFEGKSDFIRGQQQSWIVPQDTEENTTGPFHCSKGPRNCAPRLELAYLNQGEVYRLTGDNAEARKMYAKGLRINPRHADARVMFAEILWKEGKENEAIEYLKKSITRMPRSGKLHTDSRPVSIIAKIKKRMP